MNFCNSKGVFNVKVIFALVSSLSHAGLDVKNAWGDIVALYNFDDDHDEGPRGFDAQLQEGAVIERGGRGKSLKLTKQGSFGSFLNDHPLVLSNTFSIVAWVKLNPQEDRLNIGTHGLTEDGDSVGSAGMSVLPDGNLWGSFYHAATQRTLEKNVNLQTQDKNLSDNKWHHIAFTSYEGLYNLFIDGQLAARRQIDDPIYLWGDKTNIYVTNANAKGTFNDSLLIDELAFFEDGFSIYEVRAVRQLGFDAFLQAMPVEPTGKLATTWGDIKKP